MIQRHLAGVKHAPIYEFEGQRPQVHSQAVLIGQVSIAAGCYLGAGALFRGNFGRIVLGDCSKFSGKCRWAHTGLGGEVILKAGVIVGHGAILHDVHLGEKVFVGMDAVLLPGWCWKPMLW